MAVTWLYLLKQNPILSIGLTLTLPTNVDSGAEVAAPEYARQWVRFQVAGDAAEVMANPETFEWPRAKTRWGTIVGVVGYDVDGAYTAWGPVVDPIDEVTPATLLVDAGDVVRIKGGDLMARDGERPPRPYGIGPYGVGPYSTNFKPPILTAVLRDAFAPEFAACAFGAANWQLQGPPSS
jgi:hypothetical protein